MDENKKTNVTTENPLNDKLKEELIDNLAIDKEYNDSHDDCCTEPYCINFGTCDIGKIENLGYVNLDACNGRFLKIIFTLANVCRGKDVAVGCLICDENDDVLAFRSRAMRLERCSSDHGELTSEFCFVFPNSNVSDCLNLKVYIITHYIL